MPSARLSLGFDKEETKTFISGSSDVANLPPSRSSSSAPSLSPLAAQQFEGAPRATELQQRVLHRTILWRSLNSGRLERLVHEVLEQHEGELRWQFATLMESFPDVFPSRQASLAARDIAMQNEVSEEETKGLVAEDSNKRRFQHGSSVPTFMRMSCRAETGGVIPILGSTSGQNIRLL